MKALSDVQQWIGLAMNPYACLNIWWVQKRKQKKISFVWGVAVFLQGGTLLCCRSKPRWIYRDVFWDGLLPVIPAQTENKLKLVLLFLSDFSTVILAGDSCRHSGLSAQSCLQYQDLYFFILSSIIGNKSSRLKIECVACCIWGKIWPM